MTSYWQEGVLPGHKFWAPWLKVWEVSDKFPRKPTSYCVFNSQTWSTIHSPRIHPGYLPLCHVFHLFLFARELLIDLKFPTCDFEELLQVIWLWKMWDNESRESYHACPFMCWDIAMFCWQSKVIQFHPSCKRYAYRLSASSWYSYERFWASRHWDPVNAHPHQLRDEIETRPLIQTVRILRYETLCSNIW
jgi:hypothetical protein